MKTYIKPELQIIKTDTEGYLCNGTSFVLYDEEVDVVGARRGGNLPFDDDDDDYHYRYGR